MSKIGLRWATRIFADPRETFHPSFPGDSRPLAICSSQRAERGKLNGNSCLIGEFPRFLRNPAGCANEMKGLRAAGAQEEQNFRSESSLWMNALRAYICRRSGARLRTHPSLPPL